LLYLTTGVKLYKRAHQKIEYMPKLRNKGFLKLKEMYPILKALLKFCTTKHLFKKVSGIIKANLSWSRTRAKFCQLTASLLVILLQLILTKFKL